MRLKFWKVWFFLLAVVVAFTCVGHSPMPSYYYPLALVATLPFIITNRYQISYEMLFLLAAALISLIVGQPDARFKSLPRLGYFVLMCLVVSPLLRTPRIMKYRRALLRYLLFLIVLLSIGSFFCYFLGINLMQIDEGALSREDFSIGGTFGGLTKHSMILGPLSALAILYILCSTRYFMRRRWIKIPLALLAAGALLFSSSRGSIIAAGIALLFLIYKHSTNRTRFFKIVLLILLVAVATFPLWEFALQGIIYKNVHRAGSDGGFFASRIYLYRHRFNEFMSNPITGVGFASAMRYDYFEVHLSGTVEYGNSWLCVFSTMGLLGAVPLFILLGTSFMRVFRVTEKNREALFLASGLVFFFIHFMLEGYIFSAGSPLCFLFWLFVCLAYDTH